MDGVPLNCLAASLGALYEGRATGNGRRLQVAMQDAMLHYCRFAFDWEGADRRVLPGLRRISA